MASLVQKVAVQVIQTFVRGSPKVFREQFGILKDLVQQVTALELNLNHRLVADQSFYNPEKDGAPVTYVHIWEDHHFTMGIFVLKNGTALPLHDHPDMHGLCKVIHGTACIKTYSKVETGEPRLPPDISKQLSPRQRYLTKPVYAHDAKEVTVDSELCVLQPQEGNYHEIRAVNGPMAFFDVLSPPYDGGRTRDCHYFKELNLDTKSDFEYQSSSKVNGQHPNLTYLLEIPQPREFFCEASPYEGPPVDPYPE